MSNSNSPSNPPETVKPTSLHTSPNDPSTRAILATNPAQVATADSRQNEAPDAAEPAAYNLLSNFSARNDDDDENHIEARNIRNQPSSLTNQRNGDDDEATDITERDNRTASLHRTTAVLDTLRSFDPHDDDDAVVHGSGTPSEFFEKDDVSPEAKAPAKVPKQSGAAVATAEPTKTDTPRRTTPAKGKAPVRAAKQPSRSKKRPPSKKPADTDSPELKCPKNSPDSGK